MAPPKNTSRFARIVAEAFSALGVTQAAFQQLGGPSDTTLRKIVDAEPVGVSPRTLNGLDRAFGWAPGSAARTLAGGDPLPVATAEDLQLQLISELRDEATRARVELARAEARRDGDPAKWSDGDERLRDQLLERVAAAQDHLATAVEGRARAAQDAQTVKLVDLWMMANRLSNPDALDVTELTDTAVALARSVAAFAEAAVGGYSRMQELRQARVEVDARGNDSIAGANGSNTEAESYGVPEAQQSDYDLAAGYRDVGQSEGRRRREKQDFEAEHPDE